MQKKITDTADTPALKISDLIPNHTARNLNIGAYGLGNTVQIEAGNTVAMGDDTTPYPILHFAIPLAEGGTHSFQLVFRNPAALERLMERLTLLMIGGLYPDAVDSVEAEEGAETHE